MTPSLERRLLVSFTPLVALVAALGAAGLFLLHRLGNASGEILRENYDSVVAMVGLDEAVERINDSFLFALAGRPEDGEEYRQNWQRYRDALRVEQQNITLPGEGDLVARLEGLTERYREEGDRFGRLRDPAERSAAYFGTPG